MTIDPRPDFDAEWRAELEDRAAERVDRDWLHALERTDRERAWADAARERELLADRAEFARREAERDELDARYGHGHDYGQPACPTSPPVSGGVRCPAVPDRIPVEPRDTTNRSRPRLLDLFCGAGGAAVGYHRAGFDVVGVDINPQPHYPYEFMRADAIGVMREFIMGLVAQPIAWDINDFDAVHASPPCQSFSAYRRKGQGVGEHYPNLIASTRSLLQRLELPYVIENVVGAPLNNPIRLCGSSFGLNVRRHRLFESNISLYDLPCYHEWQTPRFPPATNRTNLRSTVEVGVRRIPLAIQQDAMGIDWMTLTELSQAIPPAYTKHIGAQLIAHLTVSA